MSWYFVCVWYPQKPEKRMEFSGIRITDSCEVSHGVGTQTWVLWRNTKFFYLLNHLSGPLMAFYKVRHIKHAFTLSLSNSIAVDLLQTNENFYPHIFIAALL